MFLNMQKRPRISQRKENAWRRTGRTSSPNM
nr:MAG TPA: hypothetical protein [Caudoviricetes sp.]